MKITNLKKLTISALVLVMNNPSYDDDTRIKAEKEFRHRIKNLGYDINDFAQSELEVIMRRGYDFDNYLIGQNPSLQLLMELYFRYHNYGSEEKTLLFSENHLCDDVRDKKSFFDNICRLEVANIEEIKMLGSWSEGLIEAYNLLLERTINVHTKPKTEKNSTRSNSLFAQRLFDYGNNLSDEEKQRIDASVLLRAKYSLMERLNETVMQSDFAQVAYGSYFIKKDSSLLGRQKSILYWQAKTPHELDYNTEEMAYALKLTK